MLSENFFSEAAALLKEIKDVGYNVHYDKLFLIGGSKKLYGLKNFKTLEKLIKDIYNQDTTINEAEIKQNEFAEWLDELKVSQARRSKYIDLKESASKNLKNFTTDGEKLFMDLKIEYYRSLKNGLKTDSIDQRPNILDTPEQIRSNEFLQQIEKDQKYINMKLFDKYYPYGRSDEMFQDLCDWKSIVDNGDKLVLLDKSFDYITDKAKKMPPSKNKNKFVKILNVANEILKFNEQIRWGQELKILTPDQILSRLSIYLAQLKAENNSEKFKNEIRQLLYSLYRSKNSTKIIYYNLISTV